MEYVSDRYLFISESRKKARYNIGGEYFSTKNALKKFPQLIGILQPRRKIKQKSLEDKFRCWFVKGKISKKVFNVEPPQFRETNSALNKTFREYLCDDKILNNYDVPSLFQLLDENIKKVLRENMNTKVYLNVRALMRKTSDGKKRLTRFTQANLKLFKAPSSSS